MLGVALVSLIFALTMGSMGTVGRGFLADLRQADLANLGSAFLGGVIFNAANIMLVAAIAIAGMSVAFPVGIGLALVLGVFINYVAERTGNPMLLTAGVLFVTAAIVIDALAYRRLPGQSAGGGTKGLVLSVACGVLMSLFYFLVARSLAKVVTPDGAHLAATFENLPKGVLEAGRLTAYTANVLFASGHSREQFPLQHPDHGQTLYRPAGISLSAYFRGTARDHLWGLVGGGIWSVGMSLNIAAASTAGPAISYGLGQGATLVAAFWGVFIWREFQNARAGTSRLLGLMFIAYVVGLVLVIAAG